MGNKIYYKISNTEIVSMEHFYKMYRFVFFKTFIFCIDIYPSQMLFSVMIAANNMSLPVKNFNLWRLK